MQRSNLALAIIACAALETACVPLAPGADQVRLTQNPGDVTSCKAAGDIHLPRDPASDMVPIADAQRLFRNQVVGLGGNVGLVTTGLVAVPNDGVAYRCP